MASSINSIIKWWVSSLPHKITRTTAKMGVMGPTTDGHHQRTLNYKYIYIPYWNIPYHGVCKHM